MRTWLEIGLPFCLLLNVQLNQVMSTYRTFYANSGCQNSGLFVISVGSRGKNSSGILKSSRTQAFTPGINCTIVIRPTEPYGVVVSIRLLNLQSQKDCGNFLKIYTDPRRPLNLCGYDFDEMEYKSYTTEGEMIMWFHTTNETTPDFPSHFESTAQFQLTFTSLKKGRDYCEVDEMMCENNRCIWNGLLCDGHNNCGDLSDELQHRLSKCGKYSGTLTLGIIIPIIVGSLAFLVILICCLQDRITKKIEILGRFNVERSPSPASSSTPTSDLNGTNQTTTTNRTTITNRTTTTNQAIASNNMSISHMSNSTNSLIQDTPSEDIRIRGNLLENPLSSIMDLPPYDHPPSYIVATKILENK